MRARGTVDPAPRRGDWEEFLGRHVKVYDGASGDSIMGEGEVIAVCRAPTITIRAADGTLTHHSTALPIEVMEWNRV